MNDSNDVVEPSNLPQRRLPLGELLVMAGVLDRTTLKEALARQRGSRVRLGTLLVQMGVLTESQITQAVAGQLGLHVVDLMQFRPREDALRAVPYTVAKENSVLPLIIDDANDGGSKLLYAAFSDPTNQRAVNALQIHTGLRMRPVMIEESTLAAAIDDYYMAIRGTESTPSYLDAPSAAVPNVPEVMTLDASYITPLEATPAPDAWAMGTQETAPAAASPEQGAHAAVVETLDLAYVTPLSPTPGLDAWTASNARDFELADADVGPALELGAPAAWNDSGNAAMELVAAPLALDESVGDALDIAPAVLDPFDDDGAGRAIAAPFSSAPEVFVPDPFGDLTDHPSVLSSDDDLEEIDDAEVSPIDDVDVNAADESDPFDRSFSGFSNESDDDGAALLPALPGVSVDPFFAEPLPSEIVTLAPDQLRALISAAVERGTLDPVEIDALVQAGDKSHDR